MKPIEEVNIKISNYVLKKTEAGIHLTELFITFNNK